MIAKLYVAHLMLEGKEISRIIGRVGESAEDIRKNVLESLALVMTEVEIDVPDAEELQ